MPLSGCTFRSKARSFAVLLTVSIWLGGFTFFTGAVIRIGHKVIGHRFAFVTEVVTNWLNILCFAALLMFFWHWAVSWSQLSKKCRTAIGIAWIAMALTFLALAWLHISMDTLIDPDSRTVIDDDRFGLLHRLYMIVSTVQWISAIVQMWCLMGTL